MVKIGKQFLFSLIYARYRCNIYTIPTCFSLPHPFSDVLNTSSPPLSWPTHRDPKVMAGIGLFACFFKYVPALTVTLNIVEVHSAVTKTKQKECAL